MSKPTRNDWTKLKRIARYLSQHPRALYKYNFQRRPSYLDVFSDSNWAGCLKTRKSTQGGVCKFGGHCIRSWSSTQSIIALSSGEAEFYGVVKAASIALGHRSMFRDMSLSIYPRLYTDAEAAKGMAARTGLGRTRHIDVHYLWVQQRISLGDFTLHKIPGTANPADLCTKYLDNATIKKYMDFFNCYYAEGRSKVCPALSHVAARLPRVRLGGHKR